MRENERRRLRRTLKCTRLDLSTTPRIDQLSSNCKEHPVPCAGDKCEAGAASGEGVWLAGVGENR